VILALTVIDAGWMVFDGTRALVVGEFVAPRSGPYAGQLGPWHHLATAVGIPPRSTTMKCIFLGYGVAWLVVLGFWISGAHWGRVAMIVAAALSLWNLFIGTVVGTVILLLLLIT
jgi:hypothetical protein